MILIQIKYFLQSGLPAMNVEILNQFPSPPVPNLPALALALAQVLPQQQPLMTQPVVSMPTAPSVMPIAAPAQAPTNTSFITSFPTAQVTIYPFFCSNSMSAACHCRVRSYRRRKQMMMTFKTSKRPLNQGQGTHRSLTSKGDLVEIFLPKHNH